MWKKNKPNRTVFEHQETKIMTTEEIYNLKIDNENT